MGMLGVGGAGQEGKVIKIGGAGGREGGREGEGGCVFWVILHILYVNHKESVPAVLLEVLSTCRQYIF